MFEKLILKHKINKASKHKQYDENWQTGFMPIPAPTKKFDSIDEIMAKKPCKVVFS